MTHESKQEAQNNWEDNAFDQEFEDDNDSDFNENGNGWTDSDENVLDPVGNCNNYNANNDWGDIEVEGEEEGSEMENEYWNGYYEKADTESALHSFLKVIELAKNGCKDTDHFRFKALTEIVILYFQKSKKDTKTIEYFNEFLLCSADAKPKELNTNLHKILNTVQSNGNGNEEAYTEMYDLSMARLKAMPSNNHLWFKFGIERCHQYLQSRNKMYTKCESLSEELLQSITDHNHETAKLLQVYAVKIRLSVCLIDGLATVNESNPALQSKLSEMIEMTQRLVGRERGMTDSKAMSVIYECWAKVYASNNDWLNAYKYFKESFLCYSQMISAHGSDSHLKCLKYLLIAYMILYSYNSSVTNPFAMDEIKVYETHSAIGCMSQLLTAFENDNICAFNRLLSNISINNNDLFIRKWIGFVQSRLEGKALISLVQSYDRVRLDWLAHKLGMTDRGNGLERLIVKLIIDSELNATLDQCNAILILRPNSFKKSKDMKLLTALQNWLKSVNQLRQSINGRNISHTSQKSDYDYDFGMGRHEITDDLYMVDSAFLAWD